MKTHCKPAGATALLTFALMLLPLARPLFGAEAAAPPLSVAVLPFANPDGTPRDQSPGKTMADLVTALLSQQENLWLVERAEFDKVLLEQELGFSGLVSPDSAARIGQLTGARILVTGRLMQTGNMQVAIAKLISTETGLVLGVVAKLPATDGEVALAEALAGKAGTALTDKGQTLLPEPKKEQDIVKIIQALAPDVKRPKVSIQIPEEHFGTRVPDPAAETELGKILQAAGFQLVTPDGPTPPDYRVTGEAFSELGLRRGGFHSCRARVEIKVTQAGTGVIRSLDRQTTVAVDIAEHIAAKSALQEAGRLLAERVARSVLSN